MSLENRLDNIFTSYDESIFSDGSIDPMGLRILWTSLGNKIFNNKINTISTDIRYYTINLFHHYLLYKCTIAWSDNINRLIRKEPYINKSDLFEGVIIFLENVLTHSAVMAQKGAPVSITVPGLNKLNGLLLKNDKKNTAKKLIVKRTAGILVRQYLLGIHGRHKGPFTQMGILASNIEDPYANSEVWKKVEILFSTDPWKSSAELLLNLIDTKILSAQPRHGKEIEYNVEEILSSKIVDGYFSILTPTLFSDERIKRFWEDSLGLRQGSAANLFDMYKSVSDKQDYQRILQETQRKYNDDFVNSICAIEPFLTCIDKMAKRILTRGTVSINEELIGAAAYWLSSSTIDITAVSRFLTEKYFNPQALDRLKRLLKIFSDCKLGGDSPKEFIIQLIKYHIEIMKTRGHMHWVSVGFDDKITLHKSLYLTESELKTLTQPRWVNNYYLPTMDSLYKGLNALNETF